MEEVKTKKNTDYTASAVNLKNNINLAIDMKAFRGLSAQIEELKKKMDEFIPLEMKASLESLECQLNACYAGIKTDIDQYGSYQNVEDGIYAVKQSKKSKSYKAEPFEKTYPQFAPAVIIKAVDTTKLNGLIKGGLLDEARLEADGILTITETYAYIIK
jgi:hypothetical protein